jgi:hypothetical protein
MGVGREIPPIPTVYQGENGRRHPRVRCRMIECSNGEMVDISVSGARLLWKGRMPFACDEVMEVDVEGVENTFKVKGRIKWIRSTGWRRYDVGIEFVDPSTEVKQELVEIAKLTARW